MLRDYELLEIGPYSPSPNENPTIINISNNTPDVKWKILDSREHFPSDTKVTEFIQILNRYSRIREYFQFGIIDYVNQKWARIISRKWNTKKIFY